MSSMIRETRCGEVSLLGFGEEGRGRGREG